MKNFTYVDNSNVYLEGCRMSAVRKAFPGAKTIIDAMNNRVLDVAWQIDYGRLHEFACGDPTTIGGAKLWGSPPPGDSFWAMVERLGFKVTKYERNFANKEKKVDVAIAHQMTKDAYSGVVRRGLDEITLVAGDSDYVPVVNDLVSGGFIVHVVFWGHAAKELRETATRFVSLDDHFDFLSRVVKA
ncbi:MAG TPA: NYN domain-containing protein [Vicinamibacterales bacterium]|jgi:hypothetical protein|nr:NYN domain-containing protein [Vicinamibacterales bacterium]